MSTTEVDLETKVFTGILEKLYTNIVLVSSLYKTEDIRYFLEIYVECTDSFIARVEKDFLTKFSVRSEYILKLFDPNDNSYTKETKLKLRNYIYERNKTGIINIIKNPIYDTEETYYKEIKKKTQITGAELISNTNIACIKCKIANVYYSMKQRRSADEGSDIDYVCLQQNCGHKWKVRG